MTEQQKQKVAKMRARVFVAWFDMWAGVYWSQKTRCLYICPLPCLVIQLGRMHE